MNIETNATKVLPRLSAELGIFAGLVATVAKLLKDGNTIPFIARYRKDVHGNLDGESCCHDRRARGVWREIGRRHEGSHDAYQLETWRRQEIWLLQRLIRKRRQTVLRHV